MNVIVLQVLGKYMIIGYLDPIRGSVFRIFVEFRVWGWELSNKKRSPPHPAKKK